jgi:hypothetical protein
MKINKRNHIVNIRLTKIEKKILINLAKKKEMTIADMIRELLNKEIGKRIFKKVS